MTGIIIGAVLLISGGLMHDDNFKPNDPRFGQVNPTKWPDHREGMGYVLGAVGGAVLAWHLHDYLADQDRWKLPFDLPLRLSLTQSLVGTLAGGTLVGVGLVVHEDHATGDRDTRYTYERQRTNDYREHAGYLLGPLGAATVTLSIKGYLTHPPSKDLAVRLPSRDRTDLLRASFRFSGYPHSHFPLGDRRLARPLTLVR